MTYKSFLLMIKNPFVAGLRIDFLKLSKHYKIVHKSFNVILTFFQNLHFDGIWAKAPDILACLRKFGMD